MKIPRKFSNLTGRMLADVDTLKKGDELSVYRNDIGYLSFNHRTREYKYISGSLLRDRFFFEATAVDV